MTIQLYPTISFMVILFNFLSWYTSGQILFSWWHMVWILPVEQLVNHIAMVLQMRSMNKWGK